MNLLIPNLGSTSLKYQILEMPSEKVLTRGKLERVRDYREAIAQINTGETPIDAVALKAVHAGPHYQGTFLVDAGVIAALRQFLPAAPAHNAIYLTAIEAFQQAMPGVPIVAAFEPEFHNTMPEKARLYGVPAGWRDDGVVKYGFHGASHQFISERVAAILGHPVKLVSCHLGGSSSMCASDGGKSVDTTMGFSPQTGLESATRHGDLDVFAALYMMERHGWSTDEVRRQLAKGGGLAGLSGIEGGDVRDLEAAAAEGNQRAAVALEVFAYQVKKTIGAYAAAMGGLDAVAFTGGIGENSARLRALCCEGLEFLGIRLDAAKNEQGTGDRIVSAGDSRVVVLALATNEEIVVARRAFRVLEKEKSQTAG
ncbi:MAG TPA: acetate/propionate family kinase [Bryobacteraceae bacterium]|nr:acetate/propionate family kinase [Bryobacteraceae bacterium]